MTIATPAVEADLIAKIVAAATAGGFGADFPVDRVIADGEDKAGGAIPEGPVTWVKFVDEQRENFDKDAATRAQTFQLKRRADRASDPKAAASLASMIRLHDALNKLLSWTGASGAAYDDLTCRTFPRILEQTYVVMDVVVEFYTPST